MLAALFPQRRLLWLPLDYAWAPPQPDEQHCCQTMHRSLELSCDQHDSPFECPDVALVHNDLFGEYGIPIRDGGPSYLLISHCPWCGATLPKSARDAWFDAVDASGLALTPYAELPPHLRAPAFRRSPPK